MADYVVLAISPALIMALVGSLVFFLLGVFYQGQFGGRLHWVMACFVFGAVLIARISIEEGFERAMPFGAALAVAVGVAAMKFMDYKGGWVEQFSWLINWGLIALIWWCAHRLTWDCTLADDAPDSSGEGLLQTAGLDRPADEKVEPAGAHGKQGDVAKTRPDATGDFDKRLEGTTSRQQKAGWWQRYIERQRRPHAPGVWVVYFSLAALPLFGIGQWLIPVANVAGRRHAFWLLCIYVASGMGLLLTTSFLGLRRYLRKRRIEMPTLMANLWLGTGAAVIGLLLVLAALLPRPSAEYAISRLPFTLGSPDRSGSRNAPVAREGARGKEQGPAADRSKSNDDDPDKSDDQNAGNADRASGSAGQQAPQQKPDSLATTPPDQSDSAQSKPPTGQNGFQPAGDGGKGNGSSAKGPAGEKPSSKGSQSSPKSSSAEKQPTGANRDQRGEQQSAQSKPEPAQNPDSQALAEQAPDEQTKGEKAAEEQTKAEWPMPPSESQGEQNSDASNATQMPQVAPELEMGGIGELLKWVFYAIVALAVLFVMWRSRAEILSAIREFMAGLRELFAGLLGQKRTRSAAAGSGPPPEIPLAPFASYADPFATGIAGRYSTEELVRYSFEAFEAWAREHGCRREPDQTPHELARDVSKMRAFIAADARNIAELYARAAYSSGELPPTSAEQLQQLWRQMRASAAAPF
jgi:hypothetical protein